MPASNWPLLATAALLATATVNNAQSSNSTADCISLQGSKQCPSFQEGYINPKNLSGAWPWMANVVDVASFDTAAENYFTDPNQYHKTKFNVQLQCNTTNAQNATLQWQRTVYCSEWSHISYSAQCNVANSAAPPMVCQDTCLQYAGTEDDLIANPQICPAVPDITVAQNATRAAYAKKDMVDCTDWNTLAASANNATCIEGVQNEGNCGWGPFPNFQLCGYCDPSGNKTIDACCYDSKTDLSSCASRGYPLAASIKPTMSYSAGVGGATQTAPISNSMAGNDSDDTGLSKGALAGIIVGSIVGAALLGGLIAYLLAARRKNSDPEAPPRSSSGGVYGEKGGWRQSDEGTARSPSSPQKEKFASDAALAGSGAAAGTGFGFLSAIKGGGATSPESRPISSLSASSGTDGRGTTVPSVRDQYSGHDIFAGETVVAIYPYNATLNDELTLEVDEVITVDKLYDDGWALGKSASGTEGAFPLVCVTSSKGDAPNSRGGAIGTGSEDGATSANEAGFTSSVDGAVTADEGDGGFTSDAPSRMSRRR